MHENRETSGAPRRKGTRPVCEGAKPQGGRARSGEVGLHHTIDEPDEQRGAIFGGAWGEKGAGQGERMVAKLHAIKAELRLRMHEPVADVGAWLRKVVNGYYRYHAVPGNIVRLSVFGQRLRRLWRLILRRRSQRPMSWNRTTRIFQRWIPAPRVLHPYPIARFFATHPRWELYA